MHETTAGLIAATATLIGVALMLRALLSPLERRLVAAAYGCRRDQLIRNADGVLVIRPAVGSPTADSTELQDVTA